MFPDSIKIGDTFYDKKAVVPPAEEPVDDEFVQSPFDIEFFVPNDGGDYVRLGHDFESRYWNFEPRSSKKNLAYRQDPPRNALPDTGVPIRDRFNPLNKEWQFFWYGLLEYYATDMDEDALKEAWLSLTSDARALTDRHSYNTVKSDGKLFTEYVVGHNLNSPNGDMQIKELGMGGNIFKVLRRDSGRIWVDAFDVAKPPPTVEQAIEETPWLIHWATESCCTLLDDGMNFDGIHHVKPFPQIRNRLNIRTGTPYPLCGLGGEIMFYFDSQTNQKSLQFFNINNGDRYSPYVKRIE